MKSLFAPFLQLPRCIVAVRAKCVAAPKKRGRFRRARPGRCVRAQGERGDVSGPARGSGIRLSGDVPPRYFVQMPAQDCLLSLVPHLEERIIGRMLTHLELARDRRAAAVSLTTSEASLKIRLYTAGGAEPDPYVAIEIASPSGTWTCDEGGYASLTPALAGAITSPAPDDAPLWADYEPISGNRNFSASEVGTITGMSIDSSTVILVLAAHAVRVSAGMSDFFTPAVPEVVWFERR